MIRLSDHQHVILFSNDQIPTAKSKNIRKGSHSDQAVPKVRLTFQSKYVFVKYLDTNINDINYNCDIELDTPHVVQCLTF